MALALVPWVAVQAPADYTLSCGVAYYVSIDSVRVLPPRVTPDCC